MPSSTITLLLLIVVVPPVLAADSKASGSAVSEPVESGIREALRQPRLYSGAPTRPRARKVVLVRPRAARRRQDSRAELDGLVEKSHLFTADPEAASAGRLYRQLALYPTEPSGRSLVSDQDTSEEGDPESNSDDALIEEEFLLDSGDFGRRLTPESEHTALPAYPPYSHGPLAVPIEPYRSPEYGPVGGVTRQRAPAAPEPRQTGRPAPAPAPAPTSRPASEQTVQPQPAPVEVPLQGVEEKPPTPVPTEADVVQPPRPVSYSPGRPVHRRPYHPRIPDHNSALARDKPHQTPKPPHKVAAPSLYKPGLVYYPPRNFYSDRLNEVHADPLWSPNGPPPRAHGSLRSLPAYMPIRMPPGRPAVESGHQGAVGDLYRQPPVRYHHYSAQREAKKTDSFERAPPVHQRHEPGPEDSVSYGARTGNGGAFEWFSDYPVGSSHH